MGKGSKSLSCLECHTEIASRLSRGAGLHAAYVRDEPSARECVGCHSEHNGREFRIVNWDPRALDHARTGYPLVGKHRGLPCERCHAGAHVAPSERSRIRVKDLDRTFLGLDADCRSCHVDPHDGRLGGTCVACHGSDGWGQVDLKAFDHGRTRYPLEGRHSGVACVGCHGAKDGGKARYTGLGFDTCKACHQDPHGGTFAGGCESCHTTAGWKVVPAAAVKQRFDHGRTRYPLRGKHASVPCAGCHAGGDFKASVAFDRCTRCHTEDPHRGELAARQGGVECSGCHTVDGFVPSTFTVGDHARAPYALAGRHAGVSCRACHVREGRTTFKLSFARCDDCHRDAHAGQFAVAPYGNECERCHVIDGFRPSTFTLAMHDKSRFRLVDGHLAVPCGDCHRPGPAGTVAPYRFPSLYCTSCHADPHEGRFRARMEAGDARRGCEACHGTKSWKDLSRFDHATTRFALEGTHRGTPCIDCHRPPNLETTMRHVDFGAVPVECAGCHEDPHGRQFEREGRTDCADCHAPAKWVPSTFDHDRRTAFSLEGAHRNVPCRGCHAVTRPIDGKAVVFYRPTPSACEACHGKAGEPKEGA